MTTAENRLAELEARMERLEADTDPDPHAKAERLAALEADYLDEHEPTLRTALFLGLFTLKPLPAKSS